MDLLPIRISISEGPVCIDESFFVGIACFSNDYFNAALRPLILSCLEKEEASVLLAERILSRAQADMEAQVEGYQRTISAYMRKHKGAKLDIHVNFEIDGYIRVTDRISLHPPIFRDLVVYASDLLLRREVPEEICLLFIFHLSEEALKCMALKCTEQEARPAEAEQTSQDPFQLPGADVHINSTACASSGPEYAGKYLGKPGHGERERKRKKRKHSEI